MDKKWKFLELHYDFSVLTAKETKTKWIAFYLLLSKLL